MPVFEERALLILSDDKEICAFIYRQHTNTPSCIVSLEAAGMRAHPTLVPLQDDRWETWAAETSFVIV
jgi:hypothetical protein